jgi:succinylarginine dihydrolase
MTQTVEANIDGIVGPTHNYAGLSFGNVASHAHALSISNPKLAALQGLRKMKFLRDLGIPQMVMPPQPRPDVAFMRRLGFNNIADMPAELLNPLYSASSMWAANAATVSPSADTADGKVHFTPANLISNLHRSLEAKVTAQYLKHIFPGEHFAHHDPLPPQAQFSDEGAANHMRLFTSDKSVGVEIFVYGGGTQKYPSRQSLIACQTVARLHRLQPENTVFLKQKAEAIDAGVFHNDVIAMSNGRLLIYHEDAFDAWDGRLDAFTAIRIDREDLPLIDVVSTYFFNSQLVSTADGKAVVIAPMECAEHPKAKQCFDRLIGQGHIAQVHYLDVRESMKNGGGPACLRLRVALNETERAAVHPKVWLDDALYPILCRWIETHYRDKIAPNDLRDPLLAEESKRAIAELTGILHLHLDTA